MKRDRMRAREYVPLAIVGLAPVVWLALIVAPLAADGLPGIIAGLMPALKRPFDIQLCEDSLTAVLVFIAVYLLAVAIAVIERRNRRPREEYGSAKWGDPAALTRRLRNGRRYIRQNGDARKLLTRNASIGFDTFRHRLNLNVLVVGGSGSGKSRGYAKPNILNADCSLVVLDPKGELLASAGVLLENKGYEISVLDLVEPRRSHGYNPFEYFCDENGVQRYVDNIFTAVTQDANRSLDPFWDTTASMLLHAIIFYLLSEAPDYEKNMPMVVDMVRMVSVSESDEEFKSPVDMLFERLATREPDHIAVKYYDLFKKAAGKTAKSIVITLAAKLSKFLLPSVEKLMMTDELSFGRLGLTRAALFIKIPDDDSSFNFLVTILYTQLFQELYGLAKRNNNRLPVHVHFIMDEFANVKAPDNFQHILSTARGYNMSLSIVL